MRLRLDRSHGDRGKHGTRGVPDRVVVNDGFFVRLEIVDVDGAVVVSRAPAERAFRRVHQAELEFFDVVRSDDGAPHALPHGVRLFWRLVFAQTQIL